MQKGRRSKLAKLLGMGSLAISVGSALYRFRRQWMPKVEEMGEGISDKAAKVRHQTEELRERLIPSSDSDRMDRTTGH